MKSFKLQLAIRSWLKYGFESRTGHEENGRPAMGGFFISNLRYTVCQVRKRWRNSKINRIYLDADDETGCLGNGDVILLEDATGNDTPVKRWIDQLRKLVLSRLISWLSN